MKDLKKKPIFMADYEKLYANVYFYFITTIVKNRIQKHKQFCYITQRKMNEYNFQIKLLDHSSFSMVFRVFKTRTTR